MKRSIWILLSVATFSAVSFADTTFVSEGNVSGVWSIEHHPYIIQGEIRVAETDTLVITEGVRVFFEVPEYLVVEGILIALGTEADRVIFTTDTVLYPSRWGGITLSNLNGRQNRLEFVTIENATYIESGYRGGLFVNGALVDMAGCEIRNNRNGGIRAIGGATVNMIGCIVEGNSGNGGITGNLANFNLQSCMIRENVRIDGGGFYLYGTFIEMNRCVIRENHGNIWGGAMYISRNCVAVFRECNFIANRAMDTGGIDSREGADLTFEHCLFQDNISGQPGYQASGGALKLGSSTQIITNCTFVGNYCSYRAGAIYVNSGLIMKNCVFAYNRAEVTDYAIQLYGANNSIEYCCFYENGSGPVYGNIPNGFAEEDHLNHNFDPCDRYYNLFMNPQFSDTTEGNCRLASNSPCIDAGDSSLPFDQDNTISDMGYHYFDQAAESADDHDEDIPVQYTLHPAYPNPFNASVTLSYELPRTARVRLRIHNLLGQEVASLYDGTQSAGCHEFFWTASSVPSGMYVASLQSGHAKSLQKLLLLK